VPALDALRILTHAAGLPEDWQVEKLAEDQGVLCLEARAGEMPTEPCLCGQNRWSSSGWSRGRAVRAVPLHLTTVQVRLFCRRYKCTACNRSASQPSAEMDGMLLPALRDLVVAEALHHPVAEVARRYELTPSVVRRVVDVALTERLGALPKPLVRHLGIDSVRIDGEPRLALVDGDTGRYKAFYENDRPSTIRKALLYLGAPPEIITMDLSYALRKAAREVYPMAIIVADKYHVVQAVNAGFEKYRLANGPDGTQGLRQTGKASHQLAARLQSGGHIDLVAAWKWRNDLKELWKATDPALARTCLLTWLDACPSGIRSKVAGLLTTLRDWQHEISHHASGSNASTEAANRRARTWTLVSSRMDWKRVAQRLILAPSGAELEADHQQRLTVLALAGARQQRAPSNSRCASSPPPQKTSWTRLERRKHERANNTVVKAVGEGL
jgi:transposase